MRFDEDDKQRQYIISMLYLAQCVGLTDFYHRFNVRLLDVYKKEINDLKKIGFININLKKQEIELKNRNYNLKEFFYNMLKYFYRRDYIEEILKKMTEDKSV
jgi:coproporphyrinogen III oxidase-like Fe-S oxidoreductase